MNLLRRFLFLLMGLLLIALVSLFLISPQTITGWSGRIQELQPVLRVVLVVVIDALLLVIIYFQIRSDPRPTLNGLMMRGSGAIAEVSIDSARERILKAVGDVPDVVNAEAEVKPVRGRADVELHVTVLGHDVKLPAKQKEIDRALRQVINKQLGLQMAGRPRVHIQFYGEQPKPSKPPDISVPQPITPQPPKPVVSSLSTPPTPVQPQQPQKPVASLPVSDAKPASEDEPQRIGGLLGMWRRETEAAESKPVVSPPSQPPAPSIPAVNTAADDEDDEDEADTFILNSQKSSLSSMTEDIDTMDTDDVDAEEDEDDEQAESAVLDSWDTPDDDESKPQS